MLNTLISPKLASGSSYTQEREIGRKINILRKLCSVFQFFLPFVLFPEFTVFPNWHFVTHAQPSRLMYSDKPSHSYALFLCFPILSSPISSLLSPFSLLAPAFSLPFFAFSISLMLTNYST